MFSTFMSRYVALRLRAVMALTLVVVLSAFAPGTRGHVTVRSKAVIAAIKRGAEFLLSQQNSRRMWETGAYGSKHLYKRDRQGRLILKKGKPQFTNIFNDLGGETALVTEALLDVGQSLHLPELNIYSPKMRAAINFLVKVKPRGTYMASFQANAMALLPPKARYRRVLDEDAWYLLKTIHSDGAYHYFLLPPWPARPAYMPGNFDNSNTQYGVLGMWACAHAGLEIPAWYWRLARMHWVNTQFMDGGWSYHSSGRHPDHTKTGAIIGPTDTMTPAGVASLFICDEYILQRPTLEPTVDRSILMGLAWLNKNFSATNTNLYGLYGDERVALASGIQTLGGHNWYNAVAAHLVQNGGAAGRWGFDSDVIGTAYALLILDRGLNPVVINKLQYTKSFFGDWNARQRDVANFTSWLTRTYETPLNWQVVDINSPISDWLNAPIVLITGRKNPHFNKVQIAKLREYVQDGGLVLCSPDGRSGRFRNAMLRYGREVVHNRYKAKICSPKGYLYTTLPERHHPRFHRFMAISNGIRYLWIVSPIDLGAIWQGHQFSRRDYWTIPANIYYYAIGKGALSNRLQSLVVRRATQAPIQTVTMARLKYQGNWNPEPGAWPRMAKIAAREFQTQVKIENAAISSKLDPVQSPLVQMTGTGVFKLTAKQIEDLRSYLLHGGMLFADAGGGKPAFTNAFVNMVTALFPHALLNNIPLNSSLYTGSFPEGQKAQVVTYRKFYNYQHGHVRKYPQMLGIKLHGRWVVVFSPQDITSGLLGTNTWGISGYTPVSAQALARNVLCYTIHQQVLRAKPRQKPAVLKHPPSAKLPSAPATPAK